MPEPTQPETPAQPEKGPASNASTSQAQPQILLTNPPFGGVPIGMFPPQFALQQVQVWQGQFPPPDAIERYEQVMPGTFNRLMSMAERQQEASIASANDARSALRADTKRGHWLGFSITLLAMIGAVACAVLGQTIVARLF